MKIVRPYYEIIQRPLPIQFIESIGRVCYKSEDKITPDSAGRFVRRLVESQHESVLEHAVMSVRFVCDRGVSHELVRHRLASFSQESTRYVSSVAMLDREVTTDQDVIELYLAGASMRRVAELSSGRFTEWQVYCVLEENDVERRPRGNTGPVAADFFHTIDTIEKAYLLGMVQADGSLRSGNNPQLSITQHGDHSWYLHRMVTDFIRPSASANKDKDCRQITVTSPEIWNDLVAKGVVPNKSHDQTEADVASLWGAVPPHLIPSFLRGFLDGDGGVRFYRQNNSGKTDSCNVHWAGNKYLLERVSSWLSSAFGYSPSVLPVAGTKNLHRVTITKPDIGDAVVASMLDGFRWPYGHPAKTARMIERVGGEYPVADFGDPKFVVIKPCWAKTPEQFWLWLKAMDSSERSYANMRRLGSTPEQARSVLPNSLKTELIMSANLREWRHVLKLRTAKQAHPQMRELMVPLLADCQSQWPEVFA